MFTIGIKYDTLTKQFDMQYGKHAKHLFRF